MPGLEGKAVGRFRVMARDGERPPIDTADRFGACPQAMAYRIGVLGID